MKNTIVIGATGTIGSAISQLLQTKGYEVIKASRNSVHRIDIESTESISALFSEKGSVDAIICAAGDASFGAFSKLSDEQISIGLKSKLMGQVNLCRVGLQKLNPNGVIILTGGIFAHQPWPETTNIAMVNAALEGFVKALALELTEGRRILVVHPPFVKETAEALQMDGSQCPAVSEVALIYLQGLENAENGKALFVNEKHTINQ
jgi:NAD(P)-dependent dehydrogenase (short-subunit alcohol dehydrogenase family)